MDTSLITGLIAGGTLVGLPVFMFRESIKAALARSLNDQAERLKHELQRDMIKAELSTTKLHAVYPRLFSKLHHANGALAGQFGLQFAPSYEDHSIEDFERILSALNLPSEERKRILESLRANRRTGVAELEKAMRRGELQRARGLVVDARNYAILKALFLSDVVKKQALDLTGTLWSVWVDADMLSSPDVNGADRVKFYRSVQDGLKKAGEQLEAIERRMHSELHPHDSADVSASK